MWRWTFGLLLLLNLILFLWSYPRQVPLQPELPPLPEGVPRLQLLPTQQAPPQPPGNQGPAKAPQASQSTTGGGDRRGTGGTR
jgi:hypothetical protein